MRILSKCLMLFGVAAPLLAQSSSAQSGDEAAIREIVRKYIGSRDKRDAKALEALFTSDADQLVSSGEWRKGRNAVVQGTLASSRNSGGKRTITITSIRFLAPGVALADGPYELEGLAGGQSRRMWTSLILTRTAGGWRIAAIRNMFPAAPVPTRSTPAK
jgi:uncharacterized protein (TIGR02246 family)